MSQALETARKLVVMYCASEHVYVQVNVTLVCGTDQASGKTGRLIHIAENGMCQYELKLMTPIACAPQRPKQLNSEL